MSVPKKTRKKRKELKNFVLTFKIQQFPTSQNLASWAGVSPENKESAGKRYSTKTVKGNPPIKSALCEAAWAVSRSRNHWLASKYWSIATRRGKKKALVAISH